ncbi:rhomboid family intramembrane serine protease [Halobaculum gomorrense]|uniref:Membrane associated serine protease, rhomboid family n=1 Tax=Halobaculum gomorrense TaxID=43928 RepID=A0A1M5JTT8_9EURY|nr:rhomboid family intramembrane serine protease [Halobaculum gomorrense]SHG43825.1 Membrane associated serine protease, rhomboid family [Halobaculum gomorrense]
MQPGDRPAPTADWRAFVATLRRQYRTARIRTTLTVVALTSAVFLLQLLATWATDAPSVRALTAFLFLEGGDAVFLLSPFLHRGTAHFLSNVLVLLVLAPQERHFSPGGYWLFLVAAATLALGVGYAVLAAYSPAPNVAVYGISGLGYALGGFALTRAVGNPDDASEVDLIAAVIGVSSVITVVVNLLTSLPGSPAGVNGGHLTGLAFGLLVGALWRARSAVPGATDAP